jgi:K+-sensing histidine kinase KdpD
VRPASPCYHEIVRRERLGRDQLALAAGLLGPLAVAAILVPLRTHFPNTDAALVMLLVVVAVAANGNRLAGYLAALSTAVWFDFFLTRPYERFTINRQTDIETTVLLLVIGIAVTELAVWGRREHAAASRRAGYLAGIGVTVEAVAAGAGPPELIEEICGQLTRVLSLRSCRWQYGVAGLGQPARLQHNGQVVAGDRTWDVAAAGLPPDTETELLVEHGGLLQGRFLILPRPGTRPTQEQLMVAIALADQAGAALGVTPAGR